ncbi:MAG: TraR/DksA C4-type zinc finger protein [Sedimentisphaerales bacterium]|nr:TraR/DksA C4-type zinc finger protein [Sedimentisphaerales bacterium]
MAAPKRKAPPKTGNTSSGKSRRTGRTRKTSAKSNSSIATEIQENQLEQQVQVQDIDAIDDTPLRSPLTEEQLIHFRSLLLQRRREILGDVDIMSGGDGRGNRQDSSGDLSSMPIHMADIGTDNYEQEFTLGLIESDRKQLEDIDRALAKIPRGEYGVCEGTNRPISLTRLEARPEARYCIDFARKLEKGLVRLPEERDNSQDNDFDDHDRDREYHDDHEVNNEHDD